MANENLEAVKNQLKSMKKIELTGFTNTETATAYFQEKEQIPAILLLQFFPDNKAWEGDY